MSQGILSQLLGQFKGLGLGVQPQLQNNEIVIRIKEDEFFQAVTARMSPEQRSSIKIELHEGEMVIRVRLF